MEEATFEMVLVIHQALELVTFHREKAMAEEDIYWI
jgi:hypothetical protein